jgi:CheY-like chemotaxis protein
MGLTVATAVDGEQALRMIQEQAPAAILLDLLMPKITGIEVLRHLRAHQDTRDIPVLILTNSPRECDVEEIHRLGVSGYRVKAELSLQELGRCVAQLLAPKE